MTIFFPVLSFIYYPQVVLNQLEQQDYLLDRVTTRPKVITDSQDTLFILKSIRGIKLGTLTLILIAESPGITLYLRL